MTGGQAWWRWVVVAGGCMTTLVVFGTLNSSGVIYVGVLSTYGVSHAEAAWVPLAVQALTNLTGPFAALLGVAFSYRLVVVAAGFVSCISLILSCFTMELKYLVVTYGVLLGIGLGLSVTPTIITVGMHFEKRRSVANGICFAGSAIGSIIMPALLEFLEEKYGLRGTFLIMAGMVLNISVFGALYRPAPRRTLIANIASAHKNEKEEEEEKPFIENSSGSGRRTYSKLKTESETESADANIYDAPSVKMAPALLDQMNDANNLSIYEQRRPSEDEELIYKNGSDQGRSLVIKIKTEVPSNEGSSLAENGIRVVKSSSPPDATTRHSSRMSFLGRFSFLTEDFFLLIACGWSCLLYSLSCVLLIVPDYAITTLDNVTEADAALLISSFAVGDLVGRLGYGWLSDMRLYPSKYGYMACIMTAGLACLLAPLCPSYETLMAVCALYGLGVGCTIIQHPGLMIEYLGMEVFRTGYGFLSAIAGFVILGMVPVVGALRESTGSYVANFLLTGAILMVAGLLWFLEPFAVRRQKRTLLPNQHT